MPMNGKGRYNNLINVNLLLIHSSSQKQDSFPRMLDPRVGQNAVNNRANDQDVLAR